MKKGYKICPHCWKEIKSIAIKCQYCLKFLDEEQKRTTKECPFCMNEININESTVKKIQEYLKTKKREYVDLALLHPPYFDIIKFSNKKEDLSNANSVNDFLDMFWKVLENCKTLVKKWWYIWIVIGDKYQNSERIPLWFMYICKKQKNAWF